MCSVKDVESYSAQSFIKKLRTFFNEAQINIHANATKKTVVWKVGPMTFESATELAKASTQSDFLSMWQCANKLIKHILPLEHFTIILPSIGRTVDCRKHNRRRGSNTRES